MRRVAGGEWANLGIVPIFAPVLVRLLSPLRWLVALTGAVWLCAQDPRPLVGPGATKEEVIDAYGWPSGQSKSGVKEVLSYPQGLVTLENGRVESVAFTMKTPWPAPRPRPGSPSATSVKKPEAVPDFWMTSYADAAEEAMRRRARLLALFTGSDWSPASRQFDDEVALHPDFVHAFTGDYVFLRLDFASRAAIPAEVREQNARLRERYGVSTYPTLLVLSPAGTVLAAVDLLRPQPGDSYRDRVIAAVREVRDLLALRPPEPELDPRATATAVAAPATSARPSSGSVRLMSTLFSAQRMITAAVVVGLIIVGGFFWLIWRRWSPAAELSATQSMTARISDAASGLPTSQALLAWPKERLALVVAALAESDGYVAEVQPRGIEADVVLRRPGEEQRRVLIVCAAGNGGAVSVKRVRELFGTLTAEGVDVGWYVSPAGFAAEARTFADQNNLMLIDREWLLAQLRDLPPLVLPKVLARLG